MLRPNVSHCVSENEVHYNPKKLSDEYLTFEILSDGVIKWRHTNNKATPLTISYSLDDGKTWSDIESTYSGETFNVSNGDKVLFKGTNTFYSTPVTVESDEFIDIISVPHTFSGSTASFNIRGNILSLFYGDDFADKKTYIHVDAIIGNTQLMPEIFGYTNVVSAENLLLCDDFWINNLYNGMFKGCAYLTNAPKLPFTTLAYGCYNSMFQGCTSLTTAPELPATTLAGNCYSNMFRSCTKLTTAPKLPATTLANYCYSTMFQGCTSLVNAPELPATALANWCYQYMFYGCTKLTTAPELPATALTQSCYANMFRDCTSLTTAPELPAITLADSCYYAMFAGCTSLTTAPVLPATTLVGSCYNVMFNGCISLNYIKAMFTTTPKSNYTSNWVKGVASSGTFVKNSAATWNVSGVHGIPNGWIVQTVSE